ncbi:magnesium transporter CorA family protein [Prescottella defluvii]|uniref:magnesium transporter CorA family protein n=1 Tax=Prescottella defluvii TaxID=1323361 RepID=UPI001E2E5EF1|nr:magnesium transporter CorA family protein [Prescottella defluvii]
MSCVHRNRLYRGGALVASDVPLAELAGHRADPDAVIWVDLLAPTLADLLALAPMVDGEVELHPLAIENAAEGSQRPRLVRYRDHSLLHARAVRIDGRDGSPASTRVAAFILQRALITIRSDDGFPLEPLLAEWDDIGALSERGVGFLLHSLLDQLVDGYFEVLDDLDERIQALEDELLEGSGPTRGIQLQSFALRKDVVKLSRVVLPMNEALSALLRPGAHAASAEIVPYYQDVYDHALRATERIDSLRDTIESILATSLAMQGNSLNEIMKKLTAWAAIIAIPTGVTGYFGQNIPFPGYSDPLGFWLSAVLLVGLASGLWVSFRRRGWL